MSEAPIKKVSMGDLFVSHPRFLEGMQRIAPWAYTNAHSNVTHLAWDYPTPPDTFAEDDPASLHYMILCGAPGIRAKSLGERQKPLEVPRNLCLCCRRVLLLRVVKEEKTTETKQAANTSMKESAVPLDPLEVTLSDLLANQQRYVLHNTIKITPDCWVKSRAFYEVPGDVSDDDFQSWALAELPDAASRSTTGALRLICVASYKGSDTEISVSRCMSMISMIANGVSVEEAAVSLEAMEEVLGARVPSTKLE